MSKLLDAALDSSCVICYSAALGWQSPARQGTVWPSGVSAGSSYPERIGLATLTNVTNTGVHWEATNPAVASRIDTAVDLRGVVSDYTVAVDFEAVEFSANTQCQNLAGQGPGVAGLLPICAAGYLIDGFGAYKLSIAQEISGVRQLLFAVVNRLMGRHIVSGRVLLGASNTTLSIFLDGVLIASQAYTGLPTGAASPAYTRFSVSDIPGGSYVNFFGKFYAVALFNKALTDKQITYLSQ